VPEEPLSADVLGSIAEIPAAVWNGLAPGHDGVVDNPFLDHRFLLALAMPPALGSAPCRCT